MGGLVSSVGHLFGVGGQGSGFQAQAAPLIQPVTLGQVNQGQNIATNGIGQQQDLINALQGQNGIGNQAQVFNQEQALQNQYANIAAGGGPNPALAQLNQSTGQNIANQGALLGSQRGVNQNVGLMARQIGQQGAGIQQQAAGQAATLAAQQQLAALGAQQQQQQMLGNLATQQVGQQTNAVGNLNQFGLANQGQLLNALQGYNQAQVGSTSSQNSSNAGIAQTNANNTAGQLGSTLGALPMVGKLFGADGGEVNYAEGGEAHSILAQALSQKTLPPHMKSIAQIYHPKVMKMASGGMAKGAVVPGNPKVPGKNTTKNDVVPAMLTPKEIVLPLSVTQSENPGEAAKAFVEKIKGKSSDSDFKQALRSHIKNRKSK